ncbi:MAG: polysaccharide biosynthesis C-terminal domain-containing protein [Pseudomonadota bacterium]
MLRLRHILSTGAATFVAGALNLVLVFVAARLLDPAQNGHYAQFLFVMNLVFIGFNFGITPASTYYLAVGIWTLPRTVLFNAWFLGMLAGAMLICCAILRTGLLDETLWRTFQVPIPLLMSGLVAGTLLMGVNQVIALMMGCHRYDRANVVSLLRSALPLISVLAAGVVVGGPLAIATGQTLAMVGVLIIGARLLQGSIAPTGRSPGGAPQESIWRYGGLAYLSNLFHFIAIRGLLLYLSFYAAPDLVGYFNIALLLLEALLLLPSTIGQLIFPQSSSPAFDRTLLESLLRINLYVAFLIAALVALLARPFVPLLLGSDYSSVGAVLVHLTPSIVLLSIPRILSQVLSGRGHPEYPLAAALAGAALGALLAPWWIPSVGAVGAAWITNAVSLVTAAITITGYSNVQHVRIREIFTPQIDDFVRVSGGLGGRGGHRG